MQELLHWIQSHGRVGGIVGILVSAVIGGVGVLAWRGLFPEGATHWSPLGTAIVLAIFVVAILLFVIGVVTFFRGGPLPPMVRTSPETAAALVEAIRTMGRPFYVCVGCHLAFTAEECFGACLRCGREVDCLRVEDDADLRTVIAAVSGPPED